MKSLPIFCQKIDLILSILVACLANVSVLAQVTSVAITSSLPLDNNPYQAQPDISLSNNNTYHDSNTRANSTALDRNQPSTFITDYSIINQPVLSYNTSTTSLDASQPSQVNATQYTTESKTTTSSTTTTVPSSITTSRPQISNQEPPPSQLQGPTTGLTQQTHCTLGDDTYQIGERWNPNLPPFGVQVCVLCECTIRQRKSCYESKVTCRRITNECPVIDSCPNGKKPVTVAGQCCKSCQSTGSASFISQQQDGIDNSNLQVQHQQQSPAYDSQPLFARTPDSDQQPAAITTTVQPSAMQTSFRIVYMNERIKEYMTLVKNLPACPSRDSESRASPPSSTTPQPMAPKGPKGSRNELNGIDTRLAFKSLHDSAPNYLSQPKQHKTSSSSGSQPPETRRFDHSSEDHQHPNDVQSAASASNNNFHQSPSNYNPAGGGGLDSKRGSQSTASPSSCFLGNDTFQVGDIWNPYLFPFGVQVCVRCNCVFRLRKGCHETKVTCRRINRDCPVIDECPDGKQPVLVDGQCCKTCPEDPANDEESADLSAASNAPNTTPQSSNTMPLDGIQRNEKVHREFQAISRNLNVCVKRDSVDIYNTNRYARRTRRTNPPL